MRDSDQIHMTCEWITNPCVSVTMCHDVSFIVFIVHQVLGAPSETPSSVEISAKVQEIKRDKTFKDAPHKFSMVRIAFSQLSVAFPHLRKSTLSNSPFALKDFTTKGFHDVSSCFNRAQYISAFCQVDVKSLPGGGLQVAYRAIPFGNDFPVAYWAICVCLNKSLQISAWF